MNSLHFPLSAAFLAIPLENPAKWVFQELQDRLKDYQEILRFQNPQSPHLTLQYWHELMEIEYQQVIAQAQKIAVAVQPFTMKVEGISTFGARGEDRVLYLNIPFSDELARLKKKCPWPSAQPFSPHITLVRIGHPQRFAVQKKKILKLIDDAALDVKVDKIRLYAMIEGKRQTALMDFEFSNNGVTE